MLIYGIASSIFKNIPPELTANEFPTLPVKDSINRIVEVLPGIDAMVDFNSDVWDWRPYFQTVKREYLVTRFYGWDNAAKYYVKAFFLDLVDNGTVKIVTCNNYLMAMRKLISMTMFTTGKNSLSSLTSTDIIKTFETVFWSDIAKSVGLMALIRFLEWMEEEQHIYLGIDIESLSRLLQYERDILSTKREIRKYPNIPDELFDGMINLFYKVMHNDYAPLHERMCAGMMLLTSQTGNRVNELCIYDKEPLETVENYDGGLDYIIRYNCTKAASNRLEFVPRKTFCTPLAYETIRYMQELRKQSPYADSSKFLLTFESSRKDKTGPIPYENFRHIVLNLCKKYNKKLFLIPWEGIKGIVQKDGEILYIPTVHSFRVHHYTNLIDQGFPLDFVECVIGHTPNEVGEGGYYRAKISREEREAISKFIAENISTEELDKILLEDYD